ncbi:MAG TPA: patatin-like phospholipase family protein [Actinomycetaceae bacterium]|nr:patatin-like phospholipase family protein [Actinomycetaceae bacterium]
MRITLVLGSGGARGYAHIGAIRELQERGHEIVAITGCSMGTVVGGMLAAGKLDEFEEWVRTVEVRDILRLLDPAIGAPGMIKAGRIMDMLGTIVGDINIEELELPFIAVAVDMAQRREVWFRSGPLLTAIRASIAIPTAFTPIMQDGRLLADGGLLNPLPIAPAALMNADGIVAVSLSGRYPEFGTASALTYERADHSAEQRPGWAEKLLNNAGEFLGGAGVRELIDRITSRDDADSESPSAVGGHGALTEKERIARLGRTPEPLPRSLKSIDMMTMALNTMQMSIEATRTAATPPDVLVSIPMDICGAFDFHRAAEIIDVGRERAAAAYDEAGL